MKPISSHPNQLRQSDAPLFVESRQGSGRCVRLQDERFHLIRPGPLAQLFYGNGHILVSEAFAAVLRDTCADCMELRRAEIVQVATGESFGYYYEVLPHDELVPAGVGSVKAAGCHVWHFDRSNLFVSPLVVEHIKQRGIGDLLFSPGFSRFAAAA